MQDVTREAMTFRNHYREVALPMRQWEAFLPGTGLAGAEFTGTARLGDTTRRNSPTRPTSSSATGRKILDPDLRIQDWGVTYQELEPYYDGLKYLPGRLWQSGKFERQDRTGWKPFGSAPLARVSQSSDEGAILRGPVSGRRRWSWAITRSCSHPPT